MKCSTLDSQRRPTATNGDRRTRRPLAGTLGAPETSILATLLAESTEKYFLI